VNVTIFFKGDKYFRVSDEAPQKNKKKKKQKSLLEVYSIVHFQLNQTHRLYLSRNLLQ